MIGGIDAPRVALVGARRTRQGLGPHIARFLVRHGARVPAFVCTSPATVAEAGETLAGLGIQARGYTSLEALLRAEEVGALDALAIAAPPVTHHECLLAAVERDLHVFCEKPLLLDVPGAAAEAERIVASFAGHERLLVENCQWPYTLEAYSALYPGILEQPCELFEMWLSPMGTGRAMLEDTFSHPLSMLQTLLPGDDAVIEGLRFSTADREPPTLSASFTYVSSAGRAQVEVFLEQHPSQPRPAAYAVNGCRADRRIRVEDYTFEFEGAGRVVPVPDPMEALVADFVTALRTGTLPRMEAVHRGLGARQRLFEQVVPAFTGPER